MKDYFCIGSCLPFQTINKAQLNTSKAKQTFSFGKSKRFKDIKPNCKEIAYTTNQFQTKKTGPTLGSSQRVPIVIPSEGPSPGHYRVKTQIFRDNKQFSFGLGRQNTKAYDYLNLDSVKYPSATRYQVQKKFKALYNNAPSYSLKKKCITQNQEDVSPGPAKYNIFTGKNRNLQMTKYKSISFSTSKGKRFSTGESQAPGPGAYKVTNVNGQKIGLGSSKFVSFQGSRFPNSKRKSYIDDEVQRNRSLPGPGNYRAISQFGQYDGNVYQQFTLSQMNKRNLRPQSAYLLNMNSNNSKRPQSSKR